MYTSSSPTIYYDNLFRAYNDSSQYPPIAVTDGGQHGSSHILLPERVAGNMKLGGWSDVSWACRMALATETLPSCILSLPQIYFLAAY